MESLSRFKLLTIAGGFTHGKYRVFFAGGRISSARFPFRLARAGIFQATRHKKIVNIGTSAPLLQILGQFAIEANIMYHRNTAVNGDIGQSHADAFLAARGANFIASIVITAITKEIRRYF